MPWPVARALALTFAQPLRHALTPVFGNDFARECAETGTTATATTATGNASGNEGSTVRLKSRLMCIDPRITARAARELQAYGCQINMSIYSSLLPPQTSRHTSLLSLLNSDATAGAASEAVIPSHPDVSVALSKSRCSIGEGQMRQTAVSRNTKSRSDCFPPVSESTYIARIADRGSHLEPSPDVRNSTRASIRTPIIVTKKLQHPQNQSHISNLHPSFSSSHSPRHRRSATNNNTAPTISPSAFTPASTHGSRSVYTPALASSSIPTFGSTPTPTSTSPLDPIAVENPDLTAATNWRLASSFTSTSTYIPSETTGDPKLTTDAKPRPGPNPRLDHGQKQERDLRLDPKQETGTGMEMDVAAEPEVEKTRNRKKRTHDEAIGQTEEHWQRDRYMDCVQEKGLMGRQKLYKRQGV